MPDLLSIVHLHPLMSGDGDSHSYSIGSLIPVTFCELTKNPDYSPFCFSGLFAD